MLKIKVVLSSPFQEINNGWAYRYINLLKGLMRFFQLSIFIPGSPLKIKEQLPDATVFGFDSSMPVKLKFNKINLIGSFFSPKKEMIFLPGFRYYPGYQSFIAQNDIGADLALYFGLDSLIYYGQSDRTPLIFCDFCDSIARNLHNQIARKKRNPALGSVDLIYLKRIKRRFVSRRIKIIGITDSDCAYIKRSLPHNTVITVSNGIQILSRNIDLKTKFESDYLIFTGSLNYAPNVDAVNFIVKEIWPEISERFAKLKLLIVGRNPDPQLVELCNTNPRIFIHANVADVFSFIEKSKLVICPMFLGGGLKNKVLEALICYTPVVTNKEGATGIPMTTGEHGWVGDSKQEMLQGIKELLSIDYQSYKLIAQNCYKLASRYSWDSVTSGFKDTINKYHLQLTEKKHN